MRFVEVQDHAGVDFVHVHGGTGERYMMETFGSGGGFLDYDGDDDQDLYLVQSGPVSGPVPGGPVNRLLRNDGHGRFSDQTEASGLGDAGYGMGACFADVDNDGHVDVYVTNFGPNRLFRNRGDGTFVDTTEASGTGVAHWSTSCAFADYDQDGWLDLYVVNYVSFTLATHRVCGNPEYPSYCPPDAYSGEPDVLLHNTGAGRFEDATAAAGILETDTGQGKGLGVVWTDFDGDGDADIYVANDETPNYLRRNNGDGTFTEVGVLVGAAFNGLGLPEAGMGVDAGDVDGDGDFDLFVTHLDGETNTLYRNESGKYFVDASDSSGLGPPSLPDLGFGTGLVDFDGDGDLDVLVVNGHFDDLVARYDPTQSYPQRDRLFSNQGDGRFADVSAAAGPYFADRRVGRGAAFADIDDDGDADVLITHSNGRAVLLRNESRAASDWVRVRLSSRFGGRDAVGARLDLDTGKRVLTRELRAGSSYLSQSEMLLHFGLAAGEQVVALVVRWPEGEEQRVPGSEVPRNQLFVLRQEPSASR